MSNYVITDGGRSESGIKESRDCTVRALASCTGLPYKVCHQALAKHGRKDKRGVVFKRIAHKVAKEVGYEFKQVCRSGSLRRFLRSHPKGTFYVLIRGHAMAVKDGAVLDLLKPKLGSMVKAAWAVRLRTPAQPPRERLTLAKINKAIAEFDLTLVKDSDAYGPLFYFTERSTGFHINETVLASRINGFSLNQWVTRAGLARARYNLFLTERYGLGWH